MLRGSTFSSLLPQCDGFVPSRLRRRSGGQRVLTSPAQVMCPPDTDGLVRPRIPPARSGGSGEPPEFRQREQRTLMRPRKTILCVEGNEQILSVRKFMLETRGYRVVGLTSPKAALEHLEGVMPGSVDLLLADVVLPAMDGNELVRRAKGIHPSLPALLVSNMVSSYDRAAAADAFLPKGACTPAEMLDRIRVLVTRKRGPKKQMPIVAAAPFAV